MELSRQRLDPRAQSVVRVSVGQLKRIGIQLVVVAAENVVELVALDLSK